MRPSRRLPWFRCRPPASCCSRVSAGCWGCHADARGFRRPEVLRLLLLALSAAAASAAASPAGLGPAQLGLVINVDDALSVQTGEYYRQRRHIPEGNIVRVHLPVVAEISPLQFAAVKREVDGKLPAQVQVLALAWTQPFRVACMSVTSAFAFGYDPDYCAAGCQRTPYSAYFNSGSRQPYTDYRVRPSMLVAAPDAAAARALIDRGVAADGSEPQGTAYLMSTTDEARNTRAPSFASARILERQGFAVSIRRSNFLTGRRDVLFYFTGLRWVPRPGSNGYLPGAIADHLTSTGGVLVGGHQMSALEWLKAGATGSYGTVVEPCNFAGKFPSPPIVMRHYLAGETLIEAYWKSVAMPSQGVFVGEPLAAPFRRR